MTTWGSPCSLCDRPGKVGTPWIDESSYMVCDEHFRIFVKTPEDIGLWAWCKRATSWCVIDGTRFIGKHWLADFVDEQAVCL